MKTRQTFSRVIEITREMGVTEISKEEETQFRAEEPTTPVAHSEQTFLALYICNAPKRQKEHGTQFRVKCFK
ncbi:unnamed protein product [Brassica oleracea var. botrytis]